MKLLIVDNEPNALEEISHVIQKAVPDATLYAFDKPSEALACAQKEKIDIAFLDVDMGGMSGLELARKLNFLNDHTNIVFVTVHGSYALDAFELRASNYLLKPIKPSDVRKTLDMLRYPLKTEDVPNLKVKTFGNFEVFVQGATLHFPRNKSKELLAYLVHKRGTGCSCKEIAAILYGDSDYTLSIQRQVQTIIHTLVKTLKDVGCEDVLVRSYNNIAIDPKSIECDFYQLLEGDPDAVNGYAGEYLSSYPWAKEMAMRLLDKSISLSDFIPFYPDSSF